MGVHGVEDPPLLDAHDEFERNHNRQHQQAIEPGKWLE